VCPPGFSGQRCEIRDACQSNPCMNGGTCRPANGNGYQCICPSGFTGPRCENREHRSRLFKSRTSVCFGSIVGDACMPNPCLNNGICTSSDFGGFTCQCPPGFSGQRCEDRDPCASQPCQNGAPCVSSGGGSYTCQCPTGFNGQNCEEVDICGVKNPCICGTCQNDRNAAQGFRCFCPPGYSGARCETSESIEWRLISIECDCHSVLSCLDSGEECMNSGECIRRPLGDFVCSCPFPYCGPRCQFQRPSCSGT
jgi:hypothetical protein